MAQVSKVVTASKDDVEKNKVFAVLAYLGILVLVPLLAAKDSPFAKFHANQGLLLLIIEVVLGFVLPIIQGAFVFSGLWSLANLLSLLYLIPLVFAIMGIINAANGEMKKLPYIGDYTLVK
jgi:uncharacterized membrane protein